MKLKKTKNKKESLVTIVAANYVEILIPDLLEKSFDPYSTKIFSKKHFQVSVHENTHATAGILLTVLAIEAYRNRICYLQKRVVSKNIGVELSSIFAKKNSSFPVKDFENIVSEIFVLRDIIAHNHVYKVDIEFDKEWDMLSHKQKLLKGYGDNKKFKLFTNSRTKTTVNLKLNIQPGKIGFEDLLIVLIVFDLFIGITENLLGRTYAPFNFWRKFEGGETDEFYQYLNYFYIKLSNKASLNRLNRILSSLNLEFKDFLPTGKNYFITNICFKCKKFGFKQIGNIYKCPYCKNEIKFNSSYSKTTQI